MKTFKTLTLSALFALSSLAFAQDQVATETTPNVQTNSVQAVVKEEKNAIQQTHLVNINTATAAELQDKLVGIGEKKAQAIITYREKHGAFTSVEQLTDVSGIGKALLKQNINRIALQ